MVIRNVDTVIGTNKKLIPRYRGPYEVHKVLGNDRYVIRDIENCQLTQLPYDGVVEANKIRKWVRPFEPEETNCELNECDTESDDKSDDEFSGVSPDDVIEADQLVRLAEL